jgi:hypothetical protein
MFRKRGKPYLGLVRAVESMTDAGPTITAATKLFDMLTAILTALIECRPKENCTTLDYPSKRPVVSPSETCKQLSLETSLYIHQGQRRAWLFSFPIGLISSKICGNR